MRRDSEYGRGGRVWHSRSGDVAAPRALFTLPRGLASVVALTASLVLSMALSAAIAGASEGCENEARRAEQGSTALPDCRAYELVSQPYQPTPEVTPFAAFEHSPVAEGTGPFQYPAAYSPVPVRLPAVQKHAFAASDGHAALYEAEEPNTESYDAEYIDNLSRRGSEGWTGSDLLPHESGHAGWGFCGTTIDGIATSLEWVVTKLGNGGVGEDYQHCGHDEPYLFTEAEGESRQTSNLAMRATTSGLWSLLSIYPLGVTVFDPGTAGSEEFAQYNPVFDGASADGSHVVFASQAQLTPDAPNGETYDIAGVVEGHCANEFGNLYVWSAGADHTLAITPDGIPARGTLAGAHAGSGIRSGCERWPFETGGFTSPISANGERILFYDGGGFKLESESSPGPRAPYIDGGLFLREHPAAGQSALAHGGAAGTGTVSAGSDTISSLRVTLAAGIGRTESGSNEIASPATLTGKFGAGQAIEGAGIPAGTTITEIAQRTRTLSYGNKGEEPATETYPVLVLSKAATESLYSDKLTATAEGPQPFAVGQTLVGRGIPAGTTITQVEPGHLTLSNQASASEVAVSLEASSECTEAQKACTVQLDVPEEGASGAPGDGQFQWANAEGTKVFFTDEERLTTDSTAESGKPDLYEYDLEKPAGKRLTDLTVDATEPADVLGVPGVSQDGSYVYFVARGDLTGSQQNSKGATANSGSATGEGTLMGPAHGIGKLIGEAEGTANLTESSNEVTNVVVTSGWTHGFLAGQEIEGANIPPGTTITEAKLEMVENKLRGTLMLSNKATKTAEGETLKGLASNEITELKVEEHEFYVGQALMGPEDSERNFDYPSIMPGTKITACTPNCKEATALTLSNPPYKSVSSAEISGLASYEVTGVNTSSGAFEPGMAISGPGLRRHTSIWAVGPGTITLSERPRTWGKVALSATATANLYVRHGGTTTFIASLNAEGGDQCDWTAFCLSSRVSQNGQYLAFNSIDSLTGYNNMPLRPAACNLLTSGETPVSGNEGSFDEAPCIMAYRYAAGAGAHGELTCATCSTKGQPAAEFPWALIPQAGREGPETFGDQIWINHPMADSGQFYFETEEPLVGADENGDNHDSTDVYEYSGGEGKSAQYSLISTGKSGSASEFIDASADGSNVFFETVEPLLRADTRGGYDIYDARVNGGLRSQSAAVTAPACTSTEGCLPPPHEAPAEFTSGSSALVGPGNLAVAPERHGEQSEQTKPNRCRKGLMRKHGKCVKRHHKKHKKAHHGKHASHHRRAGK